MTEQEIIRGCQQKDKRAQKLLFENYKEVLMAIIRRYMADKPSAEDVLMETFMKIFSHVGSYKGSGSFEGWMKRIAIREALMVLRKNSKMHYKETEELPTAGISPSVIQELEVETIMRHLMDLPDGYRVVLNLYAIEGYKHREIAEMLDISIHTSKSQLRMARKKIEEMLSQSDIS